MFTNVGLKLHISDSNIVGDMFNSGRSTSGYPDHWICFENEIKMSTFGRNGENHRRSKRFISTNSSTMLKFRSKECQIENCMGKC